MTHLRPSPVQPSFHKTADAALKKVREIYERNTKFLCDRFTEFGKGKVPTKPVRAFYPYVRIQTGGVSNRDPRLAYGFTGTNKTFSTTITRLDIFDHYLHRQLELLINSHDCEIEVGESDTHIPIHFALGENFHLEKDLDADLLAQLPTIFDQPNLDGMDDRIANCTYRVKPGMDGPLSLFTAPRIDLSLLRLRHYTATSSKHFQNFVIFTNYQFYIDEFIAIGRKIMAGNVEGFQHSDKDSKKRRETDPTPEDKSSYTEFVMPGDHILHNKSLNPETDETVGFKLGRMPQMPAYHLKRADGNGITMINIGVGPSNAKTITDHVAVLRPHAWLMLGHCAGLRQSQSLGDYVLAHGYLRQDNVLNKDLPADIPIPPLAEIQLALEMAVSEVIGLEGYDRKKVMRTGTVCTIDDRNWELQPSVVNNLSLSQSRAIALDMESATIAANGFRFRVPYGTLLCVSDKPFHGQLKLPGMADTFYRERVNQHLQIGLLTMAILRNIGPDRLHSRKLRSFNEVAFQ